MIMMGFNSLNLLNLEGNQMNSVTEERSLLLIEASTLSKYKQTLQWFWTPKDQNKPWVYHCLSAELKYPSTIFQICLYLVALSNNTKFKRNLQFLQLRVNKFLLNCQSGMALSLIGERIVRVPINIYHHVVPETHLYPYKGLWSVHEAKIVNAERPLSTFTKMSHRRYLVALELLCINQIHTIQQIIVMKLRKICH